MGSVYLVWAAVFVLGVTAARAVDISYTTNITSGVFDGGSAFTLGNAAGGITVTVGDGGAISNGGCTISPNASYASNTVIVTGSGVWANTNALLIGARGAGSGLIVTNGGSLYSDGSGGLGWYASGSNSWAIITGAGSVWSNISGNLSVGNGAVGCSLTVSNRAVFNTAGQLIAAYGGRIQVANAAKAVVASTMTIGSSTDNTSLEVTGVDSLFRLSSNGTVGNTAKNNSMIVSNGGAVVQESGTFYIGQNSGGDGNTVTVTGAGSVFSNSTLRVGSPAASGNNNNSMTVADGSVAFSTATVNPAYVGVNTGGTNNTVLVTGGGSAWFLAGTLNLGGTSTNNNVTIANGGLLELGGATAIVMKGTNNIITNNNGILQFVSGAPTLTGYTLSNAVVMADATLSYRGVTNVNITNNWTSTYVGLFSWNGNNTLRLDSSSGTNALAGGYVFAANQTKGSTNYVGLELINNTTALNGKNVTIGTANGAVDGGSLLASNTVATFVGVLTNYATKIILAGPSTLTASNGIVWMNGSVATTTVKNVTFDGYTTNVLNSGVVNWVQLAGATQTVNGVIKDGAAAGALVKGGAGVLILAASNLYTGATTVSNGTLLVNGSVKGAVNVAAAGALGGAGTVYGAVTNAGIMRATINDNNTSSLLTFSSLKLEAGSQLVLTGTNNLPSSTATYTIIQAAGGVAGTFASVNLPRGWRLSYTTDSVKVAPAGYPGALIMFQ
jgi:autotransporter-associated beta strand protein/T5SS/PEP-CTERM-associated repeat protein